MEEKQEKNEEKAIVTEIAGTTRDVIEDVLFIEGIKFRFIDTAGIRATKDIVESIGIERSKDAMRRAEIVLLLTDNQVINKDFIADFDEAKIIKVRNKIDLFEMFEIDLILIINLSFVHSEAC